MMSENHNNSNKTSGWKIIVDFHRFQSDRLNVSHSNILYCKLKGAHSKEKAIAPISSEKKNPDYSLKLHMCIKVLILLHGKNIRWTY